MKPLDIALDKVCDDNRCYFSLLLAVEVSISVIYLSVQLDGVDIRAYKQTFNVTGVAGQT